MTALEDQARAAQLSYRYKDVSLIRTGNRYRLRTDVDGLGPAGTVFTVVARSIADEWFLASPLDEGRVPMRERLLKEFVARGAFEEVVA